MNLGKSIKMALVQSEMSAIDLAKRTGLSDAQISLLSNNKRNASAKTLEKIAKAFGMRVSELIYIGEQDNKWRTYEAEKAKIKSGLSEAEYHYEISKIAERLGV